MLSFSVLPFVLFSTVTAHCVDSPIDWVDGSKGPGYNCKTYSVGQWCTKRGKRGKGWNRNKAFGWGKLKSKFYEGTDGKIALDACCACGGGEGQGYKKPEYEFKDYVFTKDDKKAAKKKAKKLIVPGKEWVDQYGYSCRTYWSMKFCNSDGTVGAAWDKTEFGDIKTYINAGRSAFEACEACGWKGETK